MGKKATTTEVKERASVSRERRLALALRGLLDGIEDNNPEDAAVLAQEELYTLGYSELVGIPRRVAALEAELAKAIEVKSYSRVTELGRELERARAGKPAAEVKK